MSKARLTLFLKGMAMGAADAVPGVSGGTIAFISGIYQELLDSIRRINPSSLALLWRAGPQAFWQHINGTFLLVLLSGILLSLFSFARLAVYLLKNYPELLWAFFFGLILSSAVWLLRQVRSWDWRNIAALWIGTLLALGVTLMTPVEAPVSPLTVFLAGSVAICAMILPGISGSFILLLVGMYAPVMAAIKGLDLELLGIFAAGCALGLLSFSHVLAWMFRHYQQVTLSLLTGFMLGSLNKVWPWKYTTEYRINRHGDAVPLVQDNVLPGSYQAMTGDDPYLWFALALMLVGAILVLWLESFNRSSAS